MLASQLTVPGDVRFPLIVTDVSEAAASCMLEKRVGQVRHRVMTTVAPKGSGKVSSFLCFDNSLHLIKLIMIFHLLFDLLDLLLKTPLLPMLRPVGFR